MKFNMDPLKQVKLNSLMSISNGIPELAIGLIDGPINFKHRAFDGSNIGTVKDRQFAACKSANSVACMHGTFIAGILCSRRGLYAPAICSDCTLLLYPIFPEVEKQSLSRNNDNSSNNNSFMPSISPQKLSNAIIETVNKGAKIINISAGLSSSSFVNYSDLANACDYAMRKGVILVVAAGNQGEIGGHLSIISHKWVIPVAASNEQGRLDPMSNFGPSIGIRGLMAPGVNIISTSSNGGYTQMSGTSFATPFVTGAIALLWSIFRKATAAEIIHSILGTTQNRAIIPQLLDAHRAYQNLKNITRHR